MEFLRNAWSTVSNSVTDLWYYFFGVRGSQQLLLEYVIMEEDLSSRYVYTGDRVKTTKPIKSDETYKKLVDNHNNTTSLPKGSKYVFLFEQCDY